MFSKLRMTTGPSPDPYDRREPRTTQIILSPFACYKLPQAFWCAHTQELAASRCYDKQHNSLERKGFIFIVQVTAYYLGKPGKEHKQNLKQRLIRSMLSRPSYRAQTPLPRDGSMQSGLGPPHQSRQFQTHGHTGQSTCQCF